MGQHLGEFEQIVLFTVLRLGDDAYGLAIRDAIEAHTGRSVSPGSIYTTLGRLDERRIVESRVEAPGTPGRPRKFYRLTPMGARRLQTSYQALRSAAQGVTGRLASLAEHGR